MEIFQVAIDALEAGKWITVSDDCCVEQGTQALQGSGVLAERVQVLRQMQAQVSQRG
jgi:hypothetical protein